MSSHHTGAKLEDLIKDTIELLTTGKQELEAVYSIHSELRALSHYFDNFKREFDYIFKLKTNLSKISEFKENKEIEEKFINLSKSFNLLCEEIDYVINNFFSRQNFLSLILLHTDDFLRILKNAYINNNTLIKNIDELENILREMRDLKYPSLSTRRGEKEENIIKEFSDALYNIHVKCIVLKKFLDKIIDYIKNLSEIKAKINNERAFEISKFLKSIEGEKIWIHQIISQLTGIRSIAGDLKTQEVTFRITGKSKKDQMEDLTLSIDELLTRYPPFEPIHDEVDGIIGGNVWFILTKNTKFHFSGPFSLSGKIVVKGTYEEVLDGIRLLEVETINLFHQNQEIKLAIKIESPHNLGAKSYFVWIKYGSKKLYNELMNKLKDRKVKGTSIRDIFEELQREYEQQLSRQGRKAYRVNDLGYVWYCKRGLAMSTDPFDLACPFVRYCHIGKIIKEKNQRRESCPNWLYRRRLFPKVFIESERRTSSRNLNYDNPVGVFIPVYGHGITVVEYYKGAQWYMPSVVSIGNIVRAEFEKPIIKELPSTNVVGFSLPLSLIRALISELIDENIKPKSEVLTIIRNDKTSEKVTLDKLMLSKFLLYKLTGRGYFQLNLLQAGKRTIMEKASQELERLKCNEAEMNDFLDFLIDVLGHTLAHLFYSFISATLEIEPMNLSYLYLVDRNADKLTILVFENSPYGVIDLPGHVQSRFQTYQNMLARFLEFVIKFLNDHEKDIINYKKDNLIKISAKSQSKSSNIPVSLNEIAMKLEKEWYIPLVKSNIVMDIPTFTFFLILSDVPEKLASEYGVSKEEEDEMMEWLERQLESIVRDYTGIIHCIDGCTACVMLDQGCFSAVTQNLTTSRKLVEWILKVLTGLETIYGRGGKLIDPILSLARKEVFILSPYIDDEGFEALKKVASRGVKVTILTREESIKSYGSGLRKHGIEVYPVKERHDKLIIIDDELIIETTQNLSNLNSINSFKIIRNPDKASSLKSQLLNKYKNQ